MEGVLFQRIWVKFKHLKKKHTGFEIFESFFLFPMFFFFSCFDVVKTQGSFLGFMRPSLGARFLFEGHWDVISLSRGPRRSRSGCNFVV